MYNTMYIHILYYSNILHTVTTVTLPILVSLLLPVKGTGRPVLLCLSLGIVTGIADSNRN